MFVKQSSDICQILYTLPFKNALMIQHPGAAIQIRQAFIELRASSERSIGRWH